MRALLCLLREGYGMDYEPCGDEGRECFLERPGLWVRAWDIPGIMRDEEAWAGVRFYLRWRKFGFPYGAWGENPNILVETADFLESVDRVYQPPRLA